MNVYECEEQLVSQRRGKWSESGVPHKGWTCVHIEDLEEPDITCEMCESQNVRYVHHMQHLNYPIILKVGCVCAGHLEGNLSAASNRERVARNWASRKKRWLTRKWKLSYKGNPRLNIEGFWVTVYNKEDKWGATVSSKNSSFSKYLYRKFDTENEAKLAAFDLFTLALATRS
ncbi:hypothetical protein ACRN9L_09545 [Shewanella oncorhynchi]|uniref:AP2/ERF domain-containing protein n=1 Tax=Shewanella oncorhynchi TaxID=2726434 RepID=A0ABX1KHY7_9GAMM|nr:hypothetical protein [Shewanella oncorhynchi]NLQ21314.1 hypothetical protein [Shewanella oncorhynchi]